MSSVFQELLFPHEQGSTAGKLAGHDRHHARWSWVYYCIFSLGLWLIADPFTFGAEVPAMIWSNCVTGVLLIVLSIVSLRPLALWAQWSIVLLGVWLFVAPMIFWAESGALFLENLLIGTLVVTFGLIIPDQPGITLIAKEGPATPAGWSYNPSGWDQRVIVILLAWIGFFVSRYMGAFQLNYIDRIWDPFFGEGTRNVLESDVSRSFPVSDATLGAFSYILDVLFGLAGRTDRWRTMPWVVIIFGILIVPLGVVSITLVILQPVAVGHWCTLCLTSAMVSLLMIPFALDEVLATVQLMRHEKKQRGTSYWRSFWLGGTMEMGTSVEEREQDHRSMLERTFRQAWDDLFSRPWNLVLIAFIGAFVMAAPGILDLGGSIADSCHITGALTVAFAVIAMSEVMRTLRFINIVSGLWLIAIPWLPGAEDPFSAWPIMLAGAALIALCFRKGSISDERGGFEQNVK